MADVLSRIYYDAGHPASFSSVSKLAKAAGVPIRKAKEWLMSQDTYTLHKSAKFKFGRRKVLSYGIGELMQCDLADLSKFAKFNGGVKYLLTAIDVFSKFAYAIPLKKKNADSLVKAFKTLFKQARTVVNLHTDRGREFDNKKVQALFKRYKIHHYYSFSEYKASVVERFNKTLKNKLYRIFTHRNSYKYIDILKSVLKAYNDSVHRSTGFAPSKVDSRVESLIFERLYGYSVRGECGFKTGDRVRISKIRKTFSRGYTSNWSEEIFEIFKCYPSSPPTFLLRDLKGTVLKGRFYAQELQKVLKTSRDFWKIEKIIFSRGAGDRREFYVKWLGFDKRFNSWVKAQWMRQ